MKAVFFLPGFGIGSNVIELAELCLMKGDKRMTKEKSGDENTGQQAVRQLGKQRHGIQFFYW
jgi:hypothetical protein